MMTGERHATTCQTSSSRALQLARELRGVYSNLKSIQWRYSYDDTRKTRHDLPVGHYQLGTIRVFYSELAELGTSDGSPVEGNSKGVSLDMKHRCNRR